MAIIGLILASKLFFWSAGLLSAHWFPLDAERYFLGFHHYQAEPRLTEGRVDFFHLWAYGDAEWYLSIAARGYPGRAAMATSRDAVPPYQFAPGSAGAGVFQFTEWDNDRKFAYFPLFPLLIAVFHLALPLDMAAFVVTNLVSGLALFLLHELVWLQTGNRQAALWAMILLMAYPFSAFFQAYYADGLFLLLVVAAFYFLRSGCPRRAAITGALLCLAKPTGFLIVLPLLVGWFLDPRDRTSPPSAASPRRRRAGKEAPAVPREPGRSRFPAAMALAMVPLGLVLYLSFNFWRTGSWTYFYQVQQKWMNSPSLADNLINNVLVRGYHFFQMRFLYFHSSQLDYGLMLFSLALIIFSYRRLPREWWVYALVVIWLPAVAGKDLMSFARYLSVCFPLFVWLAAVIRKPALRAVLASVFLLSSLLVHGLMANWFWVG